MALFIAVVTLVTLFLFLVAIYFHFRSLKEVSLVSNSVSEINVEELAEKIVDLLSRRLAEESTKRQSVI